MALTPEEIADLGMWPFIAFGSEAAREAAVERYQRLLEQRRADAAKSWIVQP